MIMTGTPTIHPNIITATGPLEIYHVDALNEACPACKGGRLGLLRASDTSETVHCTKCDHLENRRRTFAIRGLDGST